MQFKDLAEKIRLLLKEELPEWKKIVQDGEALARSIRIGQTAFMKKMGVASELEYKRQCIASGTITYHAHIGMNTWRETARALKQLDREAETAGFAVDRAGLCLDRRMGLPEELRRRVPSESGPMLNTQQDWDEIATCSAIQPHMGDFMIGFPASTENTLNALASGVTTIGNLSQYFAHEVPFWKDTRATAVETLRAVAVLGGLRSRGVMLHSYLEDGFGAVFKTCEAVAAWALMERYIIEDLLHCRLTHCIGGLTTDPVKRVGWVFALREIHGPGCVGSMFYGDTISFTPDFNTNRGVVCEYLLWDVMAQLACPTGHALLPLPVTEAVRIPSVAEIFEAQQLGRRIEAAARRLYPHVDLEPARQFARAIVSGGRTIFRNALDGLKEAGGDIRNPLQMLYLLKKIGPLDFEAQFASPAHADSVPTDIHLMAEQCIEENKALFLSRENKKLFAGRRVLIASTDVHRNAVDILESLFELAGARPVNIGVEKNPDEIAQQAEQLKAEAVFVSTHNGNALQYAQALRAELDRLHISVPVVIGGRLNQKVEDSALPVDVSGELKALGFLPYTRLDHSFSGLIEFKQGG